MTLSWHLRQHSSKIYHILSGLVPADGVQVVYEELLGYRRYFLWTGQILSANEALRLGVIDEVLPSARLLTRANELAEQLLKTPSITRRYTPCTEATQSRIVENVPDMALRYSITASGNPDSR